MKWNFRWRSRELITYQSRAHRFRVAQSCIDLQSLIGLWAKIGHSSWNKSAGSSPFLIESWANCSSKSTISSICSRKRRLLRFQSKSTALQMAASKAWKRYLAWFWIDSNQSEQFAAKTVANEKLCLKAMSLQSHVETCIECASFDFRFQDIWSNVLLKIIIYCITDQQSIMRSRRSVLNFKLSVFTFLRSASVKKWTLRKKLCEEKIFQLQSISNAIVCIVQRFSSSILVYLVWPRYSTWAIREWQSNLCLSG